MSQKTFTARPINDASIFNSQVDIIVPFHGQYDMVASLIDSVFRFTRTNYFKLILVDDHSANSDFISDIARNAKKNSEKLKQENIISTIRHDEQKGFSSACKSGFESGESPYVCFLSSDCFIDDIHWLRHMGESLINLKPQGVRMIAPMTNNAVGGDPSQEGSKDSKSTEHVILSNDSHLTLPCFMCHRLLFSHIGGFLKEYPYGYYEDEEIAARLKKHGYKQAVCKNSFVNHIGQATIKNLWRDHPKTLNIMTEDNRKKCIEDMKLLR